MTEVGYASAMCWFMLSKLYSLNHLFLPYAACLCFCIFSCNAVVEQL